MKFINYIIFIVFEYFENKSPELARTNTINFMVLLESSLLVPLFILFNLLFSVFESPNNSNTSMKYYIGIPLAIGLMILNSHILKKKLTKNRLQEFKTKYKANNKLLVWFIFISPIIFVFIIPLIYGALNGSLKIIGN